ncbi:MAG TPA: hypothetical protein VML50_01620 [Anaeromyxobacter sp.]|nr:hypothetical protein [Anaeromyxobacter sp.]
MPQVSCSRCFAIFDAEDARPGIAPLCPACLALAPARPAVLAPVKGPPGRPRRGPRRLALAAGLVVGLAAAAGLGLLARRALRPPAAPPRIPTAAEEAAAGWIASGAVPPLPPPAERGAFVQARLEAAREALAADLPVRAAAALAEFRAALAAAPGRDDAAAGYATAFAEVAGEGTGGGDGADGPELRTAHEIVRGALARRPDGADLLAAYARLLLLVPG